MPYLIDGTVDFSGGQNAGSTPDRIAKNQYYKGVNVSSKNGSMSPRDKFIHVPFEVQTKGKELGVDYQTIFDKGKFQGERGYLADQDSYLITIRSGIIFRVDVKRKTATVLRTSGDDRISRYHRRTNIAQAGEYSVAFDWPNQPIAIKDSKARRTDFYAKDAQGFRVPEIPQSRMGVFLQNRLWIANAANEFTAGDPVGLTRNAPITFAEVFIPNAAYVNQAFNLGYGFGSAEISAMGFMSSRNAQSRNQSTNYGPLYVATRKSISVYNAELPRAQWTNTELGRIELYGTGIVGQRAHNIVGSDVMFQDVYGRVHSLTKNQNEERSGWSTTNISREVYSSWLKTVNKQYLDVGFVTYHNNRIYIGARPYKMKLASYFGQTVYDYAHQGMVVIELDNVSTMQGAAAPVWAGLWTGINPMEATSLDNELYITSKDIDGFNRTYRVSEEAKFDQWQGIDRKVRSRIYLRCYDSEQPFTDKKEHAVDLSIGELSEELDLGVYRKPLHLSRWAEWETFKFRPECPEQNLCEGFAPGDPAGFKNLTFTQPKETACNTLTGERGDEFRESQLLLDITGTQWEIHKVKFKSRFDGEPDSDGQLCDIKNNVLPKADCDFESDWDLEGVCPTPGK